MTMEHVVAPYVEARGGRVALTSVNVSSRIDGPFVEVTIRQEFRNPGSSDIEIVYNFPLSIDAVLLDMTVQLGNHTLRGTVCAKTEAAERYEEAVAGGDTPVMLEQPAPGVFTLNLGNLRAGETAIVTYRYSELNRWSGDALRFRLPTVIAPRYGDAAEAGYEPHQDMLYDENLEHRCSFTMVAVGVLAPALIDSPSHKIAVERRPGEARISLAARTMTMDRDLILSFRIDAVNRASAITGRHDGQHVVIASFNPQLLSHENPAPRILKIIVDCSGSMQGTSIAQAADAVQRVLDLLRPQDFFDIVFFGSTYRVLFGKLVKAVPDNVEAARMRVTGLQATMGNTHVGEALAAACALNSDDADAEDDIGDPDLLLITDGEVHETVTVIAAAARSDHRIFTVGVGNAVSQELVQGLAKATGGSCELVTPNENMAERIYHHFRRIHLPKAVRVEVVWPAQPDRVFPSDIESVYSRDTVHIAGWFSAPPSGKVTLRLTLADGSVHEQTAAIEPEAAASGDARPDDVAKVAAAMELRALTDQWRATQKTRDDLRVRAQELAVSRQLMSEFTNYLMVVVRAEGDKAQSDPELARIAQMYAAGWHGHGGRADTGIRVHTLQCLRSDVWTPQPGTPVAAIREFLRKLDDMDSGATASTLMVRSIRDLKALGVPDELLALVAGHVGPSVSERQAVLAFLWALLVVYPSVLQPGVEEVIRSACGEANVPRNLLRGISAAIRSYAGQ